MELFHGSRGAGPTILIVDDDAATRTFLGELLRSAGYHVLAVATGTAALAQLPAQRIDGVVLDLCLPDMDGWMVCRELRMRAPHPLPIVLVTADRPPDLAHRHELTGFTTLLFKPFLADVLLERLATVVPS